MGETLSRSGLGALGAGSAVNLERPLRLDGRLGGHIVQGHVDGTGTILERRPGEHWDVMRIAVPPPLARYVVQKGSIAVDGVSLTVSGPRQGGQLARGPRLDRGQPDPGDARAHHPGPQAARARRSTWRST